MFFRKKQSGNRTYIQLVENYWEKGKSKQRVVATIGRLEELQKSGGLESLLQSCAKYCKNSNNYISSFVEEQQLSSHQVSRLLKVSPSTVVGWINQGRLEAYRTPGKHRRITMSSLLRFLEKEGMPIPSSIQSRTSGAFERASDRQLIFVVDDDPQVMRVIKRDIEQKELPFDVDGCEDGIKALVQIGALRPDLILLDIYMEGIDGFEVCRRLMRSTPPSYFKIVAMTAHPTEDVRARILDYGAVDFWAKPIDVTQITHLLEKSAPK